MSRITLIFAACTGTLALLTGCSGEESPQPVQVVTWMTVIDDSGTEREVPSSSFMDEAGGQPTVKQILVVDRQSNKRLFLDVSRWRQQSPSQMRFVPVTTESSDRR